MFLIITDCKIRYEIVLHVFLSIYTFYVIWNLKEIAFCFGFRPTPTPNIAVLTSFVWVLLKFYCVKLWRCWVSLNVVNRLSKQYYRNVIQVQPFLVASASSKRPRDGNFVWISYFRASIEEHNCVNPDEALSKVRKQIIVWTFNAISKF